MKHLIALALKYLKRQRLRTTLTYLCIVLAVFVFNLVAAGAAVVRNIAVQDAERYGKWEVNADSLISECIKHGMDEQEAVDRIRNHVTVSDHYAYKGQNLLAEKTLPDLYSYYEYSINGEDAKNCSGIAFQGAAGNSSLMGDSRYSAIDYTEPGRDISAPDAQTEQKNLVWLPKTYEETGIRAGDSITLTLNPAVGTLPDDSPQVQALYRKYAQQIKDNPDSVLFARDRGDEGTDGKSSILSVTKLTALSKEFGYENIEFSDVQRGVPYTVTLTVAGFSDGESTWNDSFLSLPVSYLNDIDLKTGLEEPNAGFYETSQFGDHHFGRWHNLFLVMSDRMSFDSELELLYQDLGLPENDRDATLHPYDKIAGVYNLELLTLKFRGADAISMWLLPDLGSNYNSRFGVTVTVLIIAFLLWMLMRAVIDNAFEISVQERRAQFATLRIMGASRRQIAALVCFEAMFYVLAAIPVGMLGAHICGRLTAHALHRLNIGTEYQPMPLLLLVFTLLAVFAVFFSAYSSSMWASRAYAPLEATKKAELKSTKKQNIFTRDLFGSDPEKKMQKKLAKQQARFEGHLKAPKKSKLNRTPFSFLRHYTVRNIRRTRRRFVLAVVTMTIGTALFFFGGSFGAFFGIELAKHRSEIQTEDFSIYFHEADVDAIALADETFSNNPQVRSLTFYNYIETISAWNPERIEVIRSCDSGIAEEIEGRHEKQEMFPGFVLKPEAEGTETGFTAKLVLRSEYDSILKDVFGISYDEWVQKKGAVFLSGKEGAEQAKAVWFPEVVELDGIENFAPLQLAGALTLTAEQRIRLFGDTTTGYDRYGDCSLLAPLDSASLIGVLQSNNVGRHMSVRFAVRSIADYESVRSTVDDYTQNAHSSLNIDDNFATGTGLSVLIRAIVTICAVALLAVWLTGILTMVNTVNTSVLNRADELMMLRTVGMTKKSVRRTVLLESLIFVAAATLIGCVIGLAGTLWIVLLLKMEGEYMMLALWVMLGMLVLTLAVNLLIAAVAARPGLHALNKRMEEGAMLQ